MDCRFVQTRSGCRKLYASPADPATARSDALPLQADQLLLEREKSASEQPDGFEHPAWQRRFEPLVHGSLKGKLPELELAIDGFITPEQAGKIKVIKQHYEDLESRKAELESIILSLAESYSEEINLILTVPSFKNLFSAIAVVSEIGVNMDVFPTAKHLCSWAGLAPSNDGSAGKKKSVRISRAGIYIKPLLVQCATAVVKSEKHPEIRNRYLQLKKRRGHKRAVIAIARMLLTAIYHILKNKEPYNPDLYKKSDVRPFNREITVEQAILLAQAQGYRIMETAT